MIGRAVSHYRVLSELGSGGMGVVYLAEDERLGRQVALKFLPADSVRNRQALDRFRVEARAASSLSHPGICAIFDIGEDEGTPFIVMEALKGENLRDRINKGALKVADIVDIGIQLADALEAAHTQGIIHRDIKPSNIFVSDKNRAKILDFGLAKLATGTGGTSTGGRPADASTHQTIVKQITQPGSALGTVSYMSPEQARGEDVDTRTDLFSLGAVLFEMATGTQAFGGNTPAIIFDAILNHTPAPASEFNPLVPARLETIVATLLEKDRDLRYQHASDLQAELKRLRRDLDSGSLSAIPASRSTMGAAAPSRGSASASRRGSSQLPQPPPPATSSHWWRYGIAALGALVIAAVAFTIWSGRAQQPAAPVDTRAAVEPPTLVAPPVQPSAPLPAPPSLPAPVSPPAATGAVPKPLPAPPLPRPESVAPPRTPTRSTVDPRSTTPAQPGPAQPSPQPSVQPSTPAPTPAAPPPPPVQTTPPPATENAPAVAPTPAQPAPARPADTPAPQPPRTSPAAETVPPTSPESDEAVIRRAIATYKTSIETKNVALYRSVRPGLSAAEEARLRESFRQVDSQQVSITIEEVRVEGRTATARVSRQDVITSGGRRQLQNSRQTIRLEKSAAGWVITSIGG